MQRSSIAWPDFLCTSGRWAFYACEWESLASGETRRLSGKGEEKHEKLAQPLACFIHLPSTPITFEMPFRDLCDVQLQAFIHSVWTSLLRWVSTLVTYMWMSPAMGCIPSEFQSSSLLRDRHPTDSPWELHELRRLLPRRWCFCTKRRRGRVIVPLNSSPISPSTLLWSSVCLCRSSSFLPLPVARNYCIDLGVEHLYFASNKPKTALPGAKPKLFQSYEVSAVTFSESVIYLILILCQVVRFKPVWGKRRKSLPCHSNSRRIAVCSGPSLETRQYQIVLDRRPRSYITTCPPWTSRSRNPTLLPTPTTSRWDGQILRRIIMLQCITSRNQWPGRTRRRQPLRCRNERDQLLSRGCCCPGKWVGKRPETWTCERGLRGGWSMRAQEDLWWQCSCWYTDWYLVLGSWTTSWRTTWRVHERPSASHILSQDQPHWSCTSTSP